jgi:hypothetical protein
MVGPLLAVMVAASHIVSAVASEPRQSPPVRASLRLADSLAAHGPTVVTAVRARPQAPRLDGRLDDPAWASAPLIDGFLQREPHEGQAATERTTAQVVFTDDAMYIGVRAYDSHPEAIVGRLTRRDQDSPSDWIGVAIDSYHDRRTAFLFYVNPAGVKRDVYLFNDTESDDSWDGIWDVAVSRDAEGWTAEFRIPFSQLRFAHGASAFGFNVVRKISRLNEESHWRLIPRNANAVVSLFGDVAGMDGIRPPRRLELLPYTVTSGRNNIVEAGNPFTPHVSSTATMGADLKVGLGSNLTLDATINPDFGQVDADPALVNLTAFESYFPERRPFFTEGVNIFRFPVSLGDGDGANEQLFYSRRVGRLPEGTADPRGGFAETVDHTTILGAAKLSGKTASGWTVGFLGALTQEMHAHAADSLGQRYSDVVEPRSGYFVGRLQHDWRQGRTVVGLFGTYVRRDLSPAMDWLRRSAWALGADWNHRFGGDNYRIRGWAVASNVTGSAQAIALTQQSSAHYFQRPDNGYVDYDTTRTSLGGMAAQLTVGKENGFVRWSAGVDTRTPGFEVNDAGYQRDADRTIQYTWVGLRWNTPGKVFRRANLNFNQFGQWDWGWDRMGAGGNVNASATFLNYWSVFAGMNRDLGGLSTGALRGGPAFRQPGNVNGWFGVSSDDRKTLGLQASGFFFRQDASGAHGWEVDPALAVRPSGGVELTIGPSLNYNRDTWQYLAAPLVLGRQEYFFGELKQTTIALTLRGNVTFSPALSLQVYAQPFYSAGAYDGVQRVLDPRGAAWSDRMRPLSAAQLSRNAAGDLLVDLDANGVTDAQIADPDFSYAAFRSNVVLRWEYRPGSTLFVVWQQNRSGSSSDGTYRFGDATRAVFDTHPVNVFLVKLNYWLSL